VVEAEGSFEIVASSHSAKDAPALVARHQPNIVILDSGDPDRGIATVGAILRVRRATRVVVLTCGENVDHAVHTLESGAAGYLSSRSTEEELLSALWHVLDDATYVSPTLATAVIAAMRTAAQSPSTDRRTTLSIREEQIAKQLLLGHTNREIAGCLGLREKTVKHYMTILMQKFEVRNRLELALCLERPAVLGVAGVVSAWSQRNIGADGRLLGREALARRPSANAA
jgi:DNA-binding NarL/FixJ family response regulator